MPGETQQPTLDEHGSETHPAFGMVHLTRPSASPGAVLFDSEITHQRYVSMTITAATRRRSLNRDWIHDGPRKIEVAFSEAQWAQMVSSIGSSGTSCTIQWTEQDGRLPGLPHQPRLALSEAETRSAAERQYARVAEALALVEEKPTKANIRALRMAVDSAGSNMEFAARSLTEHAEEVVTKARADIEAMAVLAARDMGLPEAAAPRLLALPGSDAGADDVEAPEVESHEDEA